MGWLTVWGVMCILVGCGFLGSALQIYLRRKRFLAGAEAAAGTKGSGDHMRRTAAVLLAGASFLIPVSLSSGSEEPGACVEPKVGPVVRLQDLFSEKVSLPGEPTGDGRCELFCGVSVLDDGQGIPHCASYSCTFELRLPTGETLKRLIPLGPAFDGMTHAQTMGTDCLPWEPSYPAGTYAARFECEDKVAELTFTVEESFGQGFSIPQSQWMGVNHCPDRP